MLLSNATGTISGGNNGCDGLLSEECVSNLKDILKWSIVLLDEYPTNFLEGRIGKFQKTPLTNLSCPANIFDDFQDLISLGGTFNLPRIVSAPPLTTSLCRLRQ